MFPINHLLYYEEMMKNGHHKGQGAFFFSPALQNPIIIKLLSRPAKKSGKFGQFSAENKIDFLLQS